jgi:hypothetical protein
VPALIALPRIGYRVIAELIWLDEVATKFWPQAMEL